MFRNFKLQFLLVAGLAGLLGYAAANPKLNPFAKEDGARAEQPRQTDPPPAPVESRSGGSGVLPYPEPPFLGHIGRTVKDSTKDFPQEVHAPKRCAERAGHPDGRRGLRRHQHVRRPDSHADLRPAGEERPALHAVPHQRTLLADPRGAAHRPQPPLRRHRRASWNAARVIPGYNTLMPKSCGTFAEVLQAKRLQHRLVRQEPQHSRLAQQPGRPVRSVADGSGLRIFLRLHRRRHQPMGAGHFREHQAHRAAARRQGLFLREGHGRPRHRAHPHAARDRAGQAVADLLRAGHGPRAASCAEGVDREVQGPVRHGLGQNARESPWPAEGDGHRSAGHAADAAARGDSRPGTRSTPITRKSTPT